jgi:hypothetical protein
MSLLDFFDAINWIDRLEGAIAALRNVERGTHGKRRQKRGMLSLSVPRTPGGLSGADIERHLETYEIPIHGRRVTSEAFIFQVPAQQAAWASYLLKHLQAGQSAPPAWGANPSDPSHPSVAPHLPKRKHA